MGKIEGSALYLNCNGVYTYQSGLIKVWPERSNEIEQKPFDVEKAADGYICYSGEKGGLYRIFPKDKSIRSFTIKTSAKFWADVDDAPSVIEKAQEVFGKQDVILIGS